MAVAPIIAGEFVWLKEPPIPWTGYDEYVRLSSSWVNQLQVVNDAVERAVKNAQEIAEVTRDLAHHDNVILVMNDHRGHVANLGKRNLNLN